MIGLRACADRLIGLSANIGAIGLLVDAAVVVVENVVTKLSQSNRDALPRLHIIFRAVKDVATPVTSGILIIILVFLPLLSLQGLEGKLFRPVAITLVFALAGSLALSLTVIPVLSSFLITSATRAGTGYPPPALIDPSAGPVGARSRADPVGCRGHPP